MARQTAIVLTPLYFLFSLLMLGCNEGVSTPEETALTERNVTIQILDDFHPEYRELSSETVIQNNCGGSAMAESEVTKSRTILHTLEAGGGYEVDSRGSVGVSSTNVELGVAVAARFGYSYGMEEEITRSLKVGATPGTNMEHQVTLQEVWQVGTARVLVKDKEELIPFGFRYDFRIELSDSEDRGCPTSGVEAPTSIADEEPILSSATATPAPSPTTFRTPSSTPTEPPTVTPTVTPTAIPPTPTATQEPAIALPFFDNFDSEEGASDAWTALSGTWITADGRYTALNDPGVWIWSMLDEPTWTNYRVRVNVYISDLGTAGSGEVAIAVRALRSQGAFIAYRHRRVRDGSGWAFVERDGSTNFIVEYVDWTLSDYSTWELEVDGAQFIGRVDGVEIQRVNLTGYDHGGIALGIKCFSGCPSFDDFAVEPIP